MREPLEELIVKIAKKLETGEIDRRVIAFEDYQNKYTVVKPAVKVTVELTGGKVATIDVSDYFKGEIE